LCLAEPAYFHSGRPANPKQQSNILRQTDFICGFSPALVFMYNPKSQDTPMKLCPSRAYRCCIASTLLGLGLCLCSLFGEPSTAPQPSTQAAPLPPIEKHKFNLGAWENEIGYAQAVRVGNVLYVSGSVGGGAMPDAIKQAYDTIGRTLAAHRLGFQHVVKENIFTTDLDALKANKEARKIYYQGDFPASTWVQVSRLYNPQYVIEVEVVAVFPEEKALSQ
jgi:enamine deaminase RidA (YjgF/YER057c/UK114 family)